MARRDPDDLVVAALNEGRVDRHLTPTDIDDPNDARELRALVRAVRVARTTTPDDRLRVEDDPPSALWTAIAEAAGIDPDAGGGGRTVDTGPPSGGPAPAAAPDEERDRATVVPLRGRRSTLVGWLAPAAVAAVVLGIVGFGLANSDDGAESKELASADLSVCTEGCAGAGSGSARLVQESDGVHLHVDLSQVRGSEQGDYYELWLLNSSGPITPRSIERQVQPDGSVDVLLPADVDPSTFDIVDVSVERDDGDESHSGKSVVRGRLA